MRYLLAALLWLLCAAFYGFVALVVFLWDPILIWRLRVTVISDLASTWERITEDLDVFPLDN